ncbi:glycosyltransferase involved in cell wall biosynthesis [Wenyingzhuangia heitensis]|uniref:Glycosyltransferase involved in cell wall biosynthesis n=1 Tax=Wenyingzhuangia heitensis TaxID=1487859 RepID=A0ABX0U9F5_9FLAO|nr:glycosyltransferase family 2 protein [Wenyingzhuangia heitensis]NIJ45447.1 glycosyltransferase involved in cell wall biosynthesis [Wenyingzhuangia heitensis]
MQQPLVSIITPCYNSEKFITETIHSVLNQTYQNWELLITDDGSIDNSISIIQSFADKDDRIQLYTIKNGGAAVARNHSIKLSNGDYIAFLDSDDVWSPQKLEKQIDFMEINNYPISYTSYQRMTEDSVLLNQTVIVLQRVNYKDMLGANKIGCLTAVYNKNILGKIYMPLIRKRQDYALWLKILKTTPYAYGLGDVLAVYRIRNTSLSAKKTEMLKWNWLLFRQVEKKSIIVSIYYVLYNVYNKLLHR